MMMMNSDSSSF